MKVFINFTALVGIFLLLSCSSIDRNSGEGTVTKPSNFLISAAIVGGNAQNPNGNGSGTVNFSISATNATSYKILLGNGETKELTNGNFTYTYTTSGTNTYVIYVSAYNSGQFVSSTLSLTVFVGSSLVWSDEFNVDGAPDSAKWGCDLGSGGWGNNESQYYTNRPENVIVQDGLLKIKTLKESFSGSNYTSARILTKDKFSFKYGRVEINAKLPAGGGTWPALWMLGSNISSAGWPACGEIDIMEHVGNSLNKVHGSLHSPGRSGNTPDTSTVMVPDATTEFHIYAVDWSATSIKFYVDNQLFYTFTNTASFPFNQDFFLIINCAMGGNFGGTINPGFTSSTFEIDYVRVYN
ncbi:glycoside hydrolase family 16 protein [Flavobacterium gawalongense]|uniref:Family 16 glycosylhydrolase n=1 Tax=Flavobacterium gawalongense TaxID=2594432 RepID=A0A553BF54_9FLAO|nr:family 16 glycosylhydrolase [Flavobacterium gawalongense]TRW99756.1 family 16 glycosylhydrolase [Flavobacterium gawalongense]TRX03857.1 family 16 glycosylhydrolase [Flavobacterium gawalongense]TRX06884.1 family 16 glycosylhydrolase [Flavobacterium gawalongense]TRX07621.1 family 16 glycosylhydrolase [Flavobacterium gawalongense]TRX23497.1 family 16 glycosylhydrolase [Flavobacterium gawalongense]